MSNTGSRVSVLILQATYISTFYILRILQHIKLQYKTLTHSKKMTGLTNKQISHFKMGL